MFFRKNFSPILDIFGATSLKKTHFFIFFSICHFALANEINERYIFRACKTKFVVVFLPHVLASCIYANIKALWASHVRPFVCRYFRSLRSSILSEPSLQGPPHGPRNPSYNPSPKLHLVISTTPSSAQGSDSLTSYFCLPVLIKQ